MFVNRSPAHPHTTHRVSRHVFASVVVGALGFGLLASCSSSDSGNTDAGGSSGGSGSSSSGGASGSGSGGGSGGRSSSGSGGSGSSSGVSSSSGSSGTSSGGSGGSGSSGGSGGSGGSGSSSGGSSSGVNDGGADGTVAHGDGGGLCTNSDMTRINIDPSGFACNNQWGITGAWYCFSDTAGSSTSCPGGTAGIGVIPINTAGNAVCISGTTAATTASSTAYGAAIAVELNHPNPDAGPKSPFNAQAKNIVGFAITISGDSGGSILNINFPPAQNARGESPGVAVPGVNSGTSPITYNVLLADAIMSDNDATPIKVVDPTNVTDVQVKIDVDGTAHNYNFCVTKIVPIMAAPTATGTLTTYGPSFTENKQIVLTGLGPYGVQNDPFMGYHPVAMQASFGGGQVGFTATPNFNSGNTTPGAFPAVAYGWIKGGNFVGGKNPGAYGAAKTIMALTKATSSWSFTPGSGNWDAAYDCWLATNPDPLTAGSELMIWLAHGGVSPIGGQNTPVTIAGAPGSWTYSTGTNGTSQPVVSYVSTGGMNSVTNLDLQAFFLEAARGNRAGLSMGSYLLGCQAGFEVYNQGTWTTNSYSISIQ
ncbi:MAG: hypothetical protein M3O46_10945 [Myxococcota bacterium]|nr:hypothetical protein [Myxococcota bacterium]